MRSLVAAILLTVSIGCSGSGVEQPSPATTTAVVPTASAVPPSVSPAAPASTAPPIVASEPTSSVIVSNAVPSMEALQDLGLGEEAAACFIATIDPNNSGVVESDVLFAQAFAECL